MARKAGGLTVEQLRELAKDAAQAALTRLRAEIVAVERTFPELALSQRRRQAQKSVQQVRKRTRKMSAAARKAVSQRMKKYWAARRKTKGTK